MFDEHDVRAVIGEPHFSRGKNYFARGKVRSVKIQDGTEVVGKVSGSQRNLYSVSTSLHFESGGLRSVFGNCSCPVSYNCKHVAALLLAAMDNSAPARRSDPQQLKQPVSVPVEVARWLNDVPGKAGRAKARAEVWPPGLPAPGRDHLFYVMHRQQDRNMCISPYKAYVKKNGMIGSNFQEHDLNSAWPARYQTARDAGILGKLAFYAYISYPPRFNWPDGEELVDLVREIVETGRALLDDIHGLALSWSTPRQIDLAWEIDEASEQCLAARDCEGVPLTALPFPTPIYVDPATGETGVAETELAPRMASWLASAPPVPHGAFDAVESRLSRVGQTAPVPRLHRVEVRTGVRPEPILILRSCEHSTDWYGPREFRGRDGKDSTIVFPYARLEFAYEGAEAIQHTDRGSGVLVDGETGTTIIRRDQAREFDFVRSLVTKGRSYLANFGNLYEERGRLPDEIHNAEIAFPPILEEADPKAVAASIDFVSNEVPELRAEGWRVEIDKTWPFRLYEGPVEFSTSVESSDSDWFSLALSLEANGLKFNVTPAIPKIIAALPLDEYGQLEQGFDVARHLSRQNFYVRFEDGRYLVVNGSRLAVFAEAFLEAQGLTGFHRAEASRLFELAEALEGCGAPWTGSRELLELGRRLKSLAETPDLPAPASLHGDLRPYQLAGYGWLKALSESGFGGVLADDMGLGKTVQALALLADRHLEQETDRPSLLVVPTSLVGNWRREAARFTPDLKLLILHGPDRRKHFARIPEHHLVVTTYPLVNRDHEELFHHDYDTVVLDEAQTVKNPASGIAKRIRDIRGRQRLALTGTPIENSLQELWSLYDWLIPGLLGNRKSFTSGFRTPIEKRGDRAMQRLLSTRIKPFLMRRTKEEVASDLPAKTVIDEFVPLEGAQAALYESIRTVMDERVRQAIAARGMAASRIAILDALLKLRQVCCDPRLVKLDAARKVTASAKLARLLALLEELVAEGRKVLVFSQFVTMLRLVEAEVVARGWGYAMLHGSTKDRDVQVDNFQSGDLPIFLISLKAGGVGLNLTAADTVIIYDPWWNPAVERQAMDRTHRIGQDKPVFVHRLIAENTVEAAIQKMQARKQALADALFEGTGQGAMALTEADISALFDAV